MRNVNNQTVGGPAQRDVVRWAVDILVDMNHCDREAAHAILAETARRNHLEEADVASTLVALRGAPRGTKRPLR